MGNVELVAGDRHAGAGHGLDRARPVGVDPEALRLEVLVEVGVCDVVEERREAVVHESLRVGTRAGRAVLPCGDDVAGSLRVVLRRRRLSAQGDHYDDPHENPHQTCHPALSSPSFLADPQRVWRRNHTAPPTGRG